MDTQINDTTITLLPPEVLAAAKHLPSVHPGTLKGKDILNLTIFPAGKGSVPSLALRALADSTANTHRQILHGCKHLDRDLWGAPLDQALLEWTCRQKAKRNWQFSTLSTKLASIAGAFRLLPLYAKDMPSIHMAWVSSGGLWLM